MLPIKTPGRGVGFLLEMADAARAARCQLPCPARTLLTIWSDVTVSRTLTQWERAAAIELPTSRRIVLRNRPALSRLNA
jgi:CRP/FNR family nitrogen fixation transcriptional regulator